MATIKNDALVALKESERACNAMIAATRGDDSSCAVFNSGEFSEDQLRAIRSYLDTWVALPLSIAVKSIEGDRSFEIENMLRGIAGKGWS